MSHVYKEARVCVCGYTTINRGNWSTHKKSCSSVSSGEKELISTLKQQLASKDEQMRKQLEKKDQQLEAKDQHYQKELATKDDQIKELIQVTKRPCTVHNTTNNNRYVVEQHINVFGKESIDHISHEQIQELLADPANAVPQFIKLKHRKSPGGVNKNLCIPNQKRAIYQVVVSGEGEEKEWENKAKGEVLEQLYDDNSGHLEAEADEETRVGSRFLDHQEKVKASVGGDDGGKRYKEQLDKIHCVITS